MTHGELKNLKAGIFIYFQVSKESDKSFIIHHGRRNWRRLNPLSVSYSHPRHIWTGQPVGEPPEIKFINLAYEKIDKVLLSFSIDLTSSKDAALDPSRPIRINDQPVNIPDLPRDPYSLSYVERNDIDVTDLVRYSANGVNNKIEVFYRIRERRLMKKQFGMLKLSLKIFLPAEESEVQQPVYASPKTKFCMFCQRNIPEDSVCCPYCCERQIAGGANPKKCVNCSEMLPPRARFCKKCGNSQPN